MSDELLRYYNQELQYLRQQGDQFGRANKELAAQLQLDSEGRDDPYVERLVQSFAYLNARTRLKLDDEFPEIAGSLLEIVLPHYQRYIPSCSIVQFNLDSSQADQFQGYPIPAKSYVETEPIDGEPCRFRTAYPTTCWPFKVVDISLRGVPFEAPSFVDSAMPQLGLLRIKLQTLNTEVPFSSFQCKSLRFYLNLEPPFCFQLYELLFDSTIGVALARSPKDRSVQFLSPANALLPVGFGADEGLVDYPPQSFMGYRLLSEYFSFREKFLFCDVYLGDALANMEGASLEIYFYLKKRWNDLEVHVDSNSLQLGCCPIVNLFPQPAVPIRVTHFSSEYRVDPDDRRRRAFEVFSIESVRGSSSTGKKKEFKPFYSYHHTGNNEESHAFWHATRSETQAEDELARGSNVDIAFVDPDFNALEPGDWTVQVDLLCSNRNLPSRLPFGGGKPVLHLEGAGAIESVKCLRRPTSVKRPAFPVGLRWRAVSHLSLNYLSIVDVGGEFKAVTAFRELLSLYDFGQDPLSSNSIAGLRGLSTRPIVGRIPGDRSGAICRGLLVELDFDEDKYSSGNLYLFASVLDRFLTSYCSINSFVQTQATSNRRQGVVHRWPSRAGTQLIL